MLILKNHLKIRKHRIVRVSFQSLGSLFYR